MRKGRNGRCCVVKWTNCKRYWLETSDFPHNSFIKCRLTVGFCREVTELTTITNGVAPFCCRVANNHPGLLQQGHSFSLLEKQRQEFTFLFRVPVKSVKFFNFYNKRLAVSVYMVSVLPCDLATAASETAEMMKNWCFSFMMDGNCSIWKVGCSPAVALLTSMNKWPHEWVAIQTRICTRKSGRAVMPGRANW